MASGGEAFGRRIRQARLNLSAKLGRVVTQTELAAKLGVTGVTVGRWESGEKEPSLKVIAKLAAVLEVTPSYLAFNDGRDPEDHAAREREQEARINAAIKAPTKAPPPTRLDTPAERSRRRRKSS